MHAIRGVLLAYQVTRKQNWLSILAYFQTKFAAPAFLNLEGSHWKVMKKIQNARVPLVSLALYSNSTDVGESA